MEYLRHKEKGKWYERPLDIERDGWEGIPNLFRWLFGRPLVTTWYWFPDDAIEIGPGETVTVFIPLGPPRDVE